MTAAVPNAVAVECAEGVRHAGCVGREGAVEVRKPVVAPAKEVVVAPEKAVVAEPCRIIDGRRVCR
jgi:hypothetical protein